MTDRDERALREALRGLEATDPVDPGAARRGAAERRRNRQTLVGIVTVLVLVVGVAGLPRLLGGSGADSATSAGGEAASQAEQESAGGATAQDGSDPRRLDRESAPTARPAPDGWRTEYYRDISFRVPSAWGYAVPPQSSWCVGNRRGEPRADQRRPYVWLGTNIAVASIGCPEPRPTSLLTEHVEALAPGAATDYVEGAVREGGWWIVTRFAGSAVLVVTTTDRDRAEGILDSVEVNPDDAPCSPSSPVAGTAGTRPEATFDLAQLPPVDGVVLCQYEPVEDQGDVELPRLRATARLDGAAAQTLVDQLVSAPVNETSCPAAEAAAEPDLAVLVQIQAGGESHGAYVNPNGCRGGMTGGIDDGTTIRVLTGDACRRLLTPPIAIWSASGAVADNCMR